MKQKLVLIALLFTVESAPVSAQDAWGVIIIPSIDVMEPIVFIPLVDDQFYTVNLENAGILEGTSWVNETWGRTVVIGHTPGKFERVHELTVGDSITILSKSKPFRYEVYETLVTYIEDERWLMPTDDPTLTLITCEGQMRRIVNAKLVK